MKILTIKLHGQDIEIRPYDSSGYTRQEELRIFGLEFDGQWMDYASYLHETDWLVLREIEQGIPVPDHMKQNRANMRAKIQELQAERATDVQDI